MKEIKITQTDGEIYHVLRLGECCKNDYTLQNLQNLQIQCNPSQIFSQNYNPKVYNLHVYTKYPK